MWPCLDRVGLRGLAEGQLGLDGRPVLVQRPEVDPHLVHAEEEVVQVYLSPATVLRKPLAALSHLANVADENVGERVQCGLLRLGPGGDGKGAIVDGA